MIPILKYDKNNDELSVNYKQESFLNFISGFISICSIAPLVETLIYLPNVLSSANAISDVYETRLHTGHTDNYLSFISSKFFFVILITDLLIPNLLFFQLTRKKLNSKLIIGLCMSLIVYALHELATGGRSRMFQSVMYCFVVYLLYRKHIPQAFNKKILKYGLIVFIVFVFAFALVSISRYETTRSSEFDSIWGWLGLYAGEGSLNFNNDMWYVSNDSGGYKTIPLLMSIFEGKYISIPDIWNAGDKLGIRGNVFYTWVGGLYSDWGRYGTLVFVVVISIVFTKISKSSSRYRQISSIMFLSLLAKLLVVGPIIFSLGTTEGQAYIVVFILLTSYLKFLSYK